MIVISMPKGQLTGLIGVWQAADKITSYPQWTWPKWPKWVVPYRL